MRGQHIVFWCLLGEASFRGFVCFQAFCLKEADDIAIGSTS